jgi:hypothetical protein
MSAVICFVSPTASFSHISGCLMQGFSGLGFCVRANISEKNISSRGISTPFSSSTLKHKVDVHPEAWVGADLIVLDLSDGLGKFTTADINAMISGKNTCIVNMNDAANIQNYSEYITTFSAHNNKFAKKKGNIHPIAFGLSDDIIELSSQFDITDKKLSFVRNFNPTLNQDIRLSLELSFVQNLSKLFDVDTRTTRSDTEYAGQLAKAGLVLAYGGSYYSDLMKYDYMAERLSDLYRFDNFSTDVAVFRWDSWRFWEAAVFGCVPIQVNFEKYGLELPVLPTPWFDYIPIDFACVNTLPERIQDYSAKGENELFTIGRRSRKWAIDNYSPVATASYVYKIMTGIEPPSHANHL